ncbi:hypothetical protein CcaverHIS002_0409460 [Cutaneotrichosporon cavernicola]|uniref:Uncharacterized protein n=1 Tax=Cutaneotrichosporon cavernicola TaxID=279322 RepID=A0AA48L520_9TREE|nr:uncharacterized protein CcaverHIS019_0409390 [Cutaneotrichosporon cavernicola]BEI84342.1 hypothetical protein CcaverHIS002_0409460 [Cutaneotrichosporon cavernicola]BEI92119.1 hypothetical protein CcaverHIS019_0409390 [Cutaneotrichosporon cavernicola]BEI99889.1 hypothetical protein CcaverHIS631_0409320 [Cutaneotrichosporon cavernicola]BEJ07664.1 hypothetical protein CcaverHIS641_0409330 [Cutaneotrichosporon cavernicola]
MQSSFPSTPIGVPTLPERGRQRTATGTTPPSAHPCPQFADLVHSLYAAYRADSERRAVARSSSPGGIAAAANANATNSRSRS